MRCFVTGISGFAGVHLAEHLLDQGHDVTGIAKGGWSPRLDELAAARPGRLPRQAVEDVDVRDAAAVRAAVARRRPEGVFHLAGIAFVPATQADPRAAYDVNLMGTVALLDATRVEARSARVVVVTSGEVYGRVADPGRPIDESMPFRPVSPYGVAKAAADLAALEAHLAHGLHVVRARPFNHTGPGQSPSFVCSEFARAVAAIEAGLQEPRLRVGNLDAARDFSDVRDVVRGYRMLLEHGRAGEAYNLGSGRAVRVRDVLDQLVAKCRVAIDVELDPAKLRPSETPRVEASVRRIREHVGWLATTPLEQTLDDLFAWWRSEVSRMPRS